jgi:hypothetical protein
VRLQAAADRVAFEHIGDSATAAKQGRQPIAPERPRVDDAAVPGFGDEVVV